MWGLVRTALGKEELAGGGGLFESGRALAGTEKVELCAVEPSEPSDD